MKRACLMMGTMAMAAACATEPPPVVVLRPNPDDLASRRVCDVDSLAVERANMVSLARRLYRRSPGFGGPGGPPGGGRSSRVGIGGTVGVRLGDTTVKAGAGAGVEVEKGGGQGGFAGASGGGGPPPIGGDGPRGEEPIPEYNGPTTYDGEVGLMNPFEAQIDAQYRAVTTSCRAYIQCMEMNNYAERACGDTRQAWSESQDRFLELSALLRKGRRGGGGWGPGRERDGGPAWIGGLQAGYGKTERGD